MLPDLSRAPLFSAGMLHHTHGSTIGINLKFELLVEFIDEEHALRLGVELVFRRGAYAEQLAVFEDDRPTLVLELVDSSVARQDGCGNRHLATARNVWGHSLQWR